MAKANAVTGSTVYVPEGAPVPDELHPDVRFVGPGAPVPVAGAETAADGPGAEPDVRSPDIGTEPLPPLPEEAYPPGAVPLRPNVNAPKADWVTYAVAVDETLDYEAADELTKVDLVKRYGG